MKRIFSFLFLVPFFSNAQLSVKQIMSDPKWIGTSPSEILWSYDSKSIYFHWNPEKNTSVSSYNYQLSLNKISKASYANDRTAGDILNGRYNHLRTKITFGHKGDI